MSIWNIFKKDNKRQCKDCGVTFDYNPKIRMLRCPECVKKYRTNYATKYRDKKINKEHFEKNDFSQQKHKYNRSIIDYEYSPTGKAYIGLAKSPLMKNEKNYGFKGVKLQSENRALVMCNECGKWYKYLSNTHLQTHGLTIKKYNKKYGFNKYTSQISDVYSNETAERFETKIRHNYPRRKQASDRKKAIKKAHQSKPKNNDSVEKQNKYGTCPLQLKESFLNYIHRFKRIPCTAGHRGRVKGFPHIGTIKKRHGSINNYCKMLGLPTRDAFRNHCLYHFPDKTVFNFVYKKNSYDELYNKMLEKCPILQEK